MKKFYKKIIFTNIKNVNFRFSS